MEEKFERRSQLNDYDLEPVSYCSNCYSLQIGFVEGAENSDYCMKCGCTHIDKANIHEWEQMYRDRYGEDFVKRPLQPGRKLVDTLSMDELKEEVCTNPKWQHIVREIYPKFPFYLPKADCLLLFFSKVMKDNRLDELRDLIYQHRMRKN